MNKYLLALIPLVFCLALSFIFTVMEPKDYPHYSYPYRTENALAFLKAASFIIGIGMCITVIAMILVDDMFNKVMKYLETKSIERHEKRRQHKLQQHNKSL